MSSISYPLNSNTLANPNTPLYSGSSGVTQLVAGSNITLSPVGGTGIVTVNASAGSGGVTSVTASGAGISATPTSGAVVIANTGVTSLLAGAGISVSSAIGAITVALTGGGSSVLVPYSDNAGTGYYINLGPACIFFTRSVSSNIAGAFLGNYFCILPPPCRVVGTRGCVTALSDPSLVAPGVSEPTTADALPTVTVDTIGTLGPAKIRLPSGTGAPGANVTMVGFWSTSPVPA